MTCIENIVGTNINIKIKQIKNKNITKREQLEEIMEMINSDYKPNIELVKIAITSELEQLGYATNEEEIFILINEMNKLKHETINEKTNEQMDELTNDKSE